MGPVRACLLGSLLLMHCSYCRLALSQRYIAHIFQGYFTETGAMMTLFSDGYKHHLALKYLRPITSESCTVWWLHKIDCVLSIILLWYLFSVHTCINSQFCYCCEHAWHSIRYFVVIKYIDGLVQERHNSIANALELRLSCTDPFIYSIDIHVVFKMSAVWDIFFILKFDITFHSAISFVCVLRK